MSEIPEECVEWEVVNRLRRILVQTSQDHEHDVTHAFAAFAAICFWIRQRVPEHIDVRRPGTWCTPLDQLNLKICTAPWDLPTGALRGTGELDPSECIAWRFVRFVRDSISHGVILPINEPIATDGKGRLIGFHFQLNGVTAELSGDQMRDIGTKLADVFCKAFTKPVFRAA